MANKLNCFIFSDIFIILLVNKSFNEILEYSLLSKQFFKITQNIIKNQTKFINLVLDFQSLVQYISSKEEEEEIGEKNQSYKFKLIQYTEIEHLILKYNNKDNRYPILSNGFRDKFKSLKSIHFDMQLQSQFYDGDCNKKDTHFHNEKGLTYTFERFLMIWDYGGLARFPISNQEELNKFYSLPKVGNYQIFEYSFQLLLKYHPSKIYIKDHFDEFFCDMYKINNILKQTDSIKSIKFLTHNTTPSFVKCCINQDSSMVCKKLSSLTIKLINFCENSLKEDSEQISSELFLNTFSGLSKSNLKRLILNPRNRPENCYDSTNLPNLFKSLTGNTKLGALGLGYFEINSSDQLNPLKEFTNINTVYCDIKSLPFFSKHINENNNIIHLKINVDWNSDHTLTKQFFDSNNSKYLKSITIIYSQYCENSKISLDKESFLVYNKNKHLNLNIKKNQ